MRWIFPQTPLPQEWLKECVCKTGFRPEIQKLLFRYPFQNSAELDAFLFPSLKNIEPPEAILYLSEAVQAIHKACHTSQRIAVISDYDVDGITSMAQMHRFFQFFHYSFTSIFPRRETEGYGLTDALVNRIFHDYPPFDWLISMDCGTNSLQPISALRKTGIKILILDHHQQTQAELPDAICVNPHTQSDHHSTSALELCTAGLVFKFLHAWLKLLRKENIPNATSLRLRSFLDLVALGTVADLVPLQHDNRLLVHIGLQELQHSSSVGLQELLRIAGCSPLLPLTTEDISFQLAPRINAGGRLDTAEIPFQLLTEVDPNRCRSLAQIVDTENTNRKEMERSIVAEAETMLEAHPKQHAYVLYQPHWHVGVVGIVAGHLTRKYHCPVFVLGQQNGAAKGSGRSIPEVSLVDLLQEASPWLLGWGGHPAAAGISISLENIPAFASCLQGILRKWFPENLPEPTLPIASVLPENALKAEFLTELEQLGPFGQGNEMPIFAIENILLDHPPERFGKQGSHLRIRWNGQVAIGWGMGKEEIPLHQSIDCALRFGWSCWQGNRSLQLQWLDWKPSNKKS